MEDSKDENLLLTREESYIGTSETTLTTSNNSSSLSTKVFLSFE